MKVSSLVLSLAGAASAQEFFLLTSSNKQSFNDQYIGRVNTANLCARNNRDLPCLKTSQVVIPNGARAGDSGNSFKLHYAANQWAQDQVKAGVRPASKPKLYALYSAQGVMRKLALLRNPGEYHFNLIDVALQRDDLSGAYVPKNGSLSWDVFKVDLSTSQISAETDDEAEHPPRWAVATPKGKSGPKNIAVWNGAADDKYEFTPITLTAVGAGGV